MMDLEDIRLVNGIFYVWCKVIADTEGGKTEYELIFDANTGEILSDLTGITPYYVKKARRYLLDLLDEKKELPRNHSLVWF